MGGGDDDLLFGSEGDDTLQGERGRDEIYGGDENDLLSGGEHADTLEGGAGRDLLQGDGGDDVLNGDAGRDTLVGGLGRDTLSGGGPAADVFLFATTEEAIGDVIAAFDGKDKIDLSGFMAGGAFIDDAQFSGVAGQVRFVPSFAALSGTLRGDVDGDGEVDWKMLVRGNPGLTEDDFIF